MYEVKITEDMIKTQQGWNNIIKFINVDSIYPLCLHKNICEYKYIFKILSNGNETVYKNLLDRLTNSGIDTSYNMEYYL